jgi:CHAT domain-containing protein
MNRLLIFFLLIVFSCTEKKTPPVVKNIQLLRDSITTNKSLIAKTIQSDSLLSLNRKQVIFGKETGDLETLCIAHQNLYNILTDSVYDEAVTHLDSIILLEDQLKNNDSLKKYLAFAYGDRFYKFVQLGLNQKVVDDCEKYLLYYSPTRDTTYLPSVLNEAGMAWLQIGDKQQSIRCLERAMGFVQKKENTENIAWTSVNLANSYRENGESQKAIETATGALKLTGVSLKRKSYLNLVLAEIFNEQHQPADALTYVQIAIPLLNQLPEPFERNERLSVLYNVYGDVLFEMKKWQQAGSAYRRSLDYYSLVDSSLSNRAVGKTFISLGALQFLSGKTDSALYYYDRALKAVFPPVSGIGLQKLPTEDELRPENTIMEALDAAVPAMIKQYHEKKDASLLQQSLNCIDVAFLEETVLRRQFIFDGSKYEQGKESRKRSEQGIQVCSLLYEATKNDIWLEKAFIYAEKSRANVLLDKTLENHYSAIHNDSASVRCKELQNEMAGIDEEINALQADSITGEPLQSLVEKKRHAEDLYAGYKNQLNDLLHQSNSISAENLSEIKQRLLKNSDAIIEYFAGDSVLYRFFIGKESRKVEMTTIPLDKAEGLTRSLLPFLSDRDKYNNDPGTYALLAQELYRLVFPSLTSDSSALNKFIVIPDGQLQFLPFEALMTGKDSFLLERCQLTYGFSATSMMQQMDIPVTEYKNEGAIFAPFMRKGSRQLPALPQSKKEVSALQRFSNWRVYTSEDTAATMQNFMQHSGGARILHIASHAFANGSGSMQPRIEFADSSLLLDKIYALRLNNHLVVLSACETGIGRAMEAEGPLSLARGFYYAGARNVINSMWEVDDQSAGKIFDRFYSVLKITGEIDGSLSLAKKAYFKEAPSEKKSPYYWASFVCVGDGNYKDLQKPNRWWIWPTIASLLLLVVVWRIVLNKKSKR